VAQPPQAFIAGPAELQKRPIFRTPTSSDRKLVYHWNTASGATIDSKIWAWARRRSMKRAYCSSLNVHGLSGGMGLHVYAAY
jgi:hypothetical protein